MPVFPATPGWIACSTRELCRQKEFHGCSVTCEKGSAATLCTPRLGVLLLLLRFRSQAVDRGYEQPPILRFTRFQSNYVITGDRFRKFSRAKYLMPRRNNSSKWGWRVANHGHLPRHAGTVREPLFVDIQVELVPFPVSGITLAVLLASPTASFIQLRQGSGL